MKTAAPQGLPKTLMMVTAPESVAALLRGQLDYLVMCGFPLELVSGNSKHLAAARASTTVPIEVVSWSREIDFFPDLRGLFQCLRIVGRSQPDVVVYSTPKAGLIGSVSSFVMRVPRRIYVLRGLRYETASGKARTLFRFLEKLACACSHTVVCVSPSLREVVVRDGLAPAKKLVVLGSGSSNGVNEERFARTSETLSSGAALRSTLGIPPDAFVVGFVGRLTRDKGIVELIASFAKLRKSHENVHLLIGGDVETPCLLASQVLEELRSGDRIHSLGFVDDPVAFYAAIQVLALPTYREGFPNVVLEAGAASVPTVTTRATGAVDSVVHGETGLLCDVADASSLERALDQLIRDPEETGQMGTRARKRVLAEFTNKRLWALWAGLFAGPQARSVQLKLEMDEGSI
jgi:glycosyltransferase involved in cell wall biosynthesis